MTRLSVRRYCPQFTRNFSRDRAHVSLAPSLANPQTAIFCTQISVANGRVNLSRLTASGPPQQDKMKFLKVGRVAIITRGRYAGKKVRLHIARLTGVLRPSTTEWSTSCAEGPMVRCSTLEVAYCT